MLRFAYDSHDLAGDRTVARQVRAPITHREALAPGDRHRRMQVFFDSEFDVRCGWSATSPADIGRFITASKL